MFTCGVHVYWFNVVVFNVKTLCCVLRDAVFIIIIMHMTCILCMYMTYLVIAIKYWFFCITYLPCDTCSNILEFKIITCFSAG